MGNAIVIPSFQDWYAPAFRKLEVVNSDHLESGTFFMVFRGTIKGKDCVIKAYEYDKPLANQPDVIRADKQFKSLKEFHQAMPRVAQYSVIYVEGTTAYLARPFFTASLEEIMTFQQPPITDIEKMWLAFQISSSVSKLHSSGAYHSDIKPSNVFVEQNFFAYLTDMAPFKPRTISPNRMNFYYHFFTTSGSSGYYLAPERFSNDPDADEKIDMKAADLFSLGCVLYFIFSNGKHLFDVTSGMRYRNGKLDITEKLQQIKDENMREHITKFTSLDPKVRLEESRRIISVFPQQLKVMSDVFDSFTNTDSISVKVERLVEIMVLDKPEFRMIIIDYMNEIINKELKLDELNMFLRDYLQCLEPLTDEIKINRAIPTLALLIERFKEPVVHKIVLESIIKILKSIHTVPVEFRGVFSSFLNPLIEKSCTSFRSKMIVASFIPQYAYELERLAPITFERIAIDFSYITTTDNYMIFNCYVESLLKFSTCGFRLLNTFLFSLLSTFNFTDEIFKISVIRVFIAFYKGASNNEIRLFGEQCNESILPVCQDLLTRNISDALLIVILELLNVAFARGMADITFGYALLPIISEFMNSSDPQVKYNVQTLSELFPRSVSAISLISTASHTAQFKVTTKPVRKTVYPTIPKTEIKMPKIKPQFLTTVRYENAPIRFIQPFTADKFFVVQGNSRLRLMEITETEDFIEQNRTKLFRSKVLSAGKLGNNLVFGFDSGDIESYDVGVFQKTHISQVPDAHSTSITSFNDNTFLSTFDNGSVILYDTRAPGSQHTFQFTDVTDITSSTNVIDSDAIAAIGFSEGVFSMIDTRVMQPVWFGASPPVKHLLSLQACTSYASLCVVSDSSAVIISEPYHNVQYTINIDGAVTAPYKGGAVVLSNESSWFMHNSGCLALCDGEAFPTDVLAHINPLTMHSSEIMCAASVDNVLITGDAAGFVNISNLCKAK